MQLFVIHSAGLFGGEQRCPGGPVGQMCTGGWTFVLSEPCQAATFLPWEEAERGLPDDLC